MWIWRNLGREVTRQASCAIIILSGNEPKAKNGGKDDIVIDSSDNTIGICEGMVWVSMEDVADVLGAKGEERDEVISWLHGNISDWNDTIMDAIVDFATNKVADIVRDER